MALKKTRPVLLDNGNGAQRVFEHQIFKMLLPALGFILIGIVSWLFNTVLDLEETVQQHSIRIENLLDGEKYIKFELKELDKTVTNLRVHVGRMTAH
tara:strand:- start:535 stop:825 length:291 start_codon:yes stop_codon:yes gene_type:complete